MLPGILIIFITMVIPLGWNLVLSFMEWNGSSPMVFVKWDNYTRVFTERQAYGTILNSLFIGIVSTVAGMILGIFLALSVYRLTKRESAFCRFVYFSISMMPMTVVGLLFAFVLAPDGGLVNSLLELLHLDFLKQGWLSNPKIVNWSLACVQGWKASGTIMILFYTALIRIPPSFFEAGKLEGANYFHELRLIIMPLLKPALALTISMMLLWSFKSYDIVWTMTRGGPGDVSETAPIRMITIGFSFGQFGYAAAIGVVLTVLVSICIGTGRWITRGEAYEY
jgi:raffinose/stachyose/melibiose transport system permease protein